MANQLVPLNDFVRILYLEQIDSVSGAVSPVISGSVTAFLAVSNLPTAVAADPSLSVSAVYIGNQAGQVPGNWLILIDATALTAALLASLFTGVTPYLIVVNTGNVRVYEKLHYSASKAATLT